MINDTSTFCSKITHALINTLVQINKIEPSKIDTVYKLILSILTDNEEIVRFGNNESNENNDNNNGEKYYNSFVKQIQADPYKYLDIAPLCYDAYYMLKLIALKPDLIIQARHSLLLDEKFMSNVAKINLYALKNYVGLFKNNEFVATLS